MNNSKRSVFGIVFLTIFLDMVGFSIIFPLFPDMLDHYLFLEESMEGGILSKFVIWVREFGYDSLLGNPSFRLETVIFGGVLGSLYAALQFFFAPIWGGLSDRYGRKPILLITLITGLRLVAAAQGMTLAAEKVGKVKTVMQIASISLYLLNVAIMHDLSRIKISEGLVNWTEIIGQAAQLTLILACLLTVYSGLNYLVKYWSVFTTSNSQD